MEERGDASKASACRGQGEGRPRVGRREASAGTAARRNASVVPDDARAEPLAIKVEHGGLPLLRQCARCAPAGPRCRGSKRPRALTGEMRGKGARRRRTRGRNSACRGSPAKVSGPPRLESSSTPPPQIQRAGKGSRGRGRAGGLKPPLLPPPPQRADAGARAQSTAGSAGPLCHETARAEPAAGWPGLKLPTAGNYIKPHEAPPTIFSHR